MALSVARQDDWDDPWGTGMSHMFAVAEVLYHASADLPGKWQFRHGMADHDPIGNWHPYGQSCPLARLKFPDECQCGEEREYVPFLDAGETGIEMLTYAGRALDRYLDVVRRAGKDY